MADLLDDFCLDSASYVVLLRQLIGEAEHLQNNPPSGLVPEEGRVAGWVAKRLAPYTAEGGPVVMKDIQFHEGRSNVVLRYAARGAHAGASKCVSLFGSHMDVVPADPEAWTVDPFSLTVDGDKLYGRGTTDCLGHVALVTEFFAQLGEKLPELPFNVVAVFIAAEENQSILGVGVDKLVAEGHVEECKTGPVLWVDASDSQPCMGTAGALPWHLTCHGKRFHSGLPQRSINPIEFGMEVLSELQRKFYAKYPRHPDSLPYKYQTSSTMKPTQVKCPPGGLNQIPPSVTFSGDIRLTPFYDAAEVMASIDGWIAEINAAVESGTSALPLHGDFSKYALAEEWKGKAQRCARAEIEFVNREDPLIGVACNLSSPGFDALVSAIRTVRGEVVPYSICGSLPLVAEMKDAGFDIQITGFGLLSTYHCDDEYCLLSDMEDALKILAHFLIALI
jgi:acetylornithine deacetylase